MRILAFLAAVCFFVALFKRVVFGEVDLLVLGLFLLALDAAIAGPAIAVPWRHRNPDA